MNGMLGAIKPMLSNLKTPHSKQGQREVEGVDKGGFKSSLQGKIGEKRSESKEEKATPSKILDDLEVKKLKLNKEDSKKLKEVFEEGDLSPETLQHLINILNKLPIEEMSKKLEATEPKLNSFDRSLKNILKNLTEIKGKLLLEKNQGEFSLKNLKNLFTKAESIMDKLEVTLKSKSVQGNVQIIQHRGINQWNIGKLDRDNQNKVEREVDFKEGAKESSFVEKNPINEIISSEKSELSDKLDDKERALKEFDFSSNKEFIGAEMIKTEVDTKVDFNQKLSFKSIVKQIIPQVELAAKNLNKEITLELNPESLGKLRLKVSVNEGVVTAKIIAENGQVKDLLEGNFGSLKEALQQKDIQIEQFDIATSYNGEEMERNFSNGQFDFQNQNKNSRSNPFKFDLDDLAKVEELEMEQEEERGIDDDVNYVV